MLLVFELLISAAFLRMGYLMYSTSSYTYRTITLLESMPIEQSVQHLHDVGYKPQDSATVNRSLKSFFLFVNMSGVILFLTLALKMMIMADTLAREGSVANAYLAS